VIPPSVEKAPRRVTPAPFESPPIGGGVALLLAQAATRAIAAWDPQDASGATADDITQPLAALAEAAQRISLGGTADLRSFPVGVPARRLLDALRRAVLEDTASGAHTAEDAVSACLALERVHDTIETDAAQRFANRLSGADALPLVVEVAHDMRSPLASILFLAERLRSSQSGPLTTLQDRQLGLIYSAAFGLSALAGDVIELARGDWLVDQQAIPFSVADILQSVGAIVQPIAEEKGLAIRLVPPDADARIGFPAALNRVLLNLTTNALKFTADGSVEVTARSRSRTRLEFAVQDTGRGIPPAVMATLFDAFRRRQRPGDYTFSSAGLGLAICRKLVALMHGELGVETSESGTRFFFELDLPLASKL
jgi:signal transduction histidine kinase